MESYNMTNEDVACRKRILANDQKSIACEARGTKQRRTSNASPSFGSRPPICDQDPDYANSQAMGLCSYCEEDLRRCGCPTLDPSKNPHLWEKYKNRVREAILPKIVDGQQEEINIIFFASGYLLLESKILSYIFKLMEENQWKGNVNLNFIDRKYQIESDSIVVIDENGQWTVKKLLLTAGAAGSTAVGTHWTYKGLEQNDALQTLGGMACILIGLWFGAEAMKKEGIKKETEKEKIAEDSEKAIKCFMENLNKITPETVNRKITSFLSSVDAYITGGEPEVDLILGYDIENASDDFNQLRKEKLKDDGNCLGAVKISYRRGELIPAFIKARGKEEELKPEDILPEKTFSAGK